MKNRWAQITALTFFFISLIALVIQVVNAPW